MALQILSGAFNLASASTYLASVVKQPTPTSGGDPEAAVTDQPTAQKEPPSLEESIDGNTKISLCCAVCSILCICTLPMLIFACAGLCVLMQARTKLAVGDEDGAKQMNSIGDSLNSCVIIGNCCLTVVFGFLLFVVGFISIIVAAASG